MNEDRVGRTEEFLKQKFEEGRYLTAHPEAKAYRLEHTYRVANIGRQIAQKEGFDETEMVIACLLHDVSYCEEFGENGWIDHGRRASEISRPFLLELGFPEARVNDMCYGIAIHVDDEAGFPGERTPFAQTIGDADNIDRFDVYRIHESLCDHEFLKMSFAEKLEFAENRLVRLRELKERPMGTKSAEEIWRERLSIYIAFFEKLVSQLKCSKSIAE